MELGLRIDPRAARIADDVSQGPGQGVGQGAGR